MTNFTEMSDADLHAKILSIYAEEAKGYDATVEAMFDLPALMAWFRAGFPGAIEGMSPGMIKLAAIPLIEQGILQKRA